MRKQTFEDGGTQGECHVTVKAEMGVAGASAGQGTPPWLAKHKKPRGLRKVPPRVSEGAWPSDNALTSNFQPPEL
jgi:hypothetical protein